MEQKQLSGERISIRGAREHNLQNIDVDLPRNKLVVLSGLSGSGKSSLAFDTLFAEGQRRYMESLSAYARQFLGRMDKPDVDLIEGLSPAIAIEQKSTNKNPRSTVGTVTEIYDYYRLLFARIGHAHCPNCGREISEQSSDQIISTIMAWADGTKIQVLAPIIRGKKGEHQKIFEDARKSGFARARIDGVMSDLEETVKLDKQKKHTIEIVVDRIVIHNSQLTIDNSVDAGKSAASEDVGVMSSVGVAEVETSIEKSKQTSRQARGDTQTESDEMTALRKRIASSVETALEAANGVIIVTKKSPGDDAETEVFFSQKNACPDCGISIPELQPRLFSFNNPFGACPECTGLGQKMEWDLDMMIPDDSKSIEEWGILPYNPSSAWNMTRLTALAEKYDFSVTTPLKKLTKKQRDVLYYGSDEPIHFKYKKQSGEGYSVYDKPWPGLFNDMKRKYNEAWGDNMRESLEQKFMSKCECQACKGRRLRPEALGVTVGGKNIDEITRFSILETIEFFEKTKFTASEEAIADQILKEIRARLNFLKNVGLDYLTLERAAETLSGGEAQRIRLATQIGSGLVGVMYILDEPSIGLHQRDNQKLIATLTRLRDLGNTVIVVEHDEDTLRTADYLVDLGPGAGVHGGKIVAAGTPAEVAKVKESLTGQYLAGTLRMEIPTERRKGNGNFISIEGVSEHNLKNVSAKIPLGTFTCITGVSGSGKSTLMTDVLYPALSNKIMKSKLDVGAYKKISGIENIDKVINIDQSPIGRTPRSNPATYVGVFQGIRDLFASLPEAKAHGYTAGRFSFNVKGGRCENCQGAGTIVIEMNFLPDVYIQCDVCGGKRFNRETLDVTYKGKTINDVLNMTIDEACEFFDSIPHVARKLGMLKAVGLGYIQLGQSALTLSGGEAQRVKLANELARVSTGKTLYILDEPTTGLHFADVKQLMEVIQKLVDKGNTVLMIEHNLDVICQADYIIDMGPEGGFRGGQIIAEGTPEEVAQQTNSFTGQFVADMLKRQKRGE